jgi:5'-nucleotidase
VTAPAGQPLILLTNDDGYKAEGLLALRRELSQRARVFTVAPATEMSGTSHAITLTRPLTAELVEEEFHAVDGTPTDCVNVAVNRLMAEAPAACVSGINHGGNLGDDVGYSATVGAAFEATLFGIPSIAVSMVRGGPTSDFSSVARVTATLALQLATRALVLPEGTFLNVNAPPTAPRGVSITKLSRRRYLDPIEERIGPEGRAYYWVGGRPEWQSVPGNDHHAVSTLGHVSVTLLGTDLGLAVPGGESAAAPLAGSLESLRAALGAVAGP